MTSGIEPSRLSGWFDGRYDGVVPVELVVPSGTGVTLRLEPSAHLDEDDHRHLLGRGKSIFLFRSVAELAAYLAEGEEHTLAHRPVWRTVRDLPPDELRPSAVDRIDLIGFGALLDGSVPPPHVADDELGDRIGHALDLVADVAEQGGLSEVEDRLGEASPLWRYAQTPGLLLRGAPGDTSADRDRARAADDWRRILAAVDQAVTWPLVQVSLADLRATQAAEAAAAAGPDPDAATGLVDLERAGPFESVWLGLGEHGAGYTLRERTEVAGDPDQRWLVERHRVVLAASLDGLAAYVATGAAESAVADIPGWERIVELARRGSLDLEPYEDNVVDVAGIATRIRPAMAADDAQALLDAYWLLFALATTQGFPEVAGALDEGEPIGRFVSGTVTDLVSDPASGRARLVDENLDRIRAEWWQLVTYLAGRVTWLA